ncbi:MAG: 23S rRNA (pseudouridine(1915)-N(3))-methyltransferase RlmH, partial [Dialister micraerophilus]|nr:23S rRNA (pseudouridine(1915)-N(3))-methyltransferase RlmH [Dialister micraerophilus]
MVIIISAIGKIKEKWMKEGIDEYLKRLKPFAKMNIIEHEEEKMPGNPSPAIKKQIMEKEGDKLLKAVSDSDCVILLDTEGTAFSSEELAAWLQDKMVQGTSHFYFMIGGPYGNGENIKKRADLKIS